MRVRTSVLLACALCTVAVGAQSAKGRLTREFERRKTKVLVESGQRHLRIGSWARKAGLTTQATNEFLEAVRVSENRHPGALRVLSLMRVFDDRFWLRKRKRPSKRLLESYARRVAKAKQQNAVDRIRLAGWAAKNKLEDVARKEYVSVLRVADAELKFDKDGRIVLRGGKVPAKFAAEIKKDAVRINDKLYVRDAFLALLPDVGQIDEVSSEHLRVRSQLGAAHAKDLHALCTAMLPVLEEEMSGRPGRTVNIFVFKEQKTYEVYLGASALVTHREAAGLAEYRTFTGLVSAEGKKPEQVQAIALHELAHLFYHGTSPGVMPSWYTEAFAETFGGEGTFRWEEGRLVARGEMAAHRVTPLQRARNRQPLRDLLTLDALAMLAKNPKAAVHFYAQSWAFLRYLRRAAGLKTKEKLAKWEAACRGGALGAVPGKVRSTDQRPAAELFMKLFGEDLDRLEREFVAYLERL